MVACICPVCETEIMNVSRKFAGYCSPAHASKDRERVRSTRSMRRERSRRVLAERTAARAAVGR